MTTMNSGVYAPNTDFLGVGQVVNRHLLQVAQPKAVVLRYEGRDGHTHRKAHADWLHSIGCTQHVIVVNPDNEDLAVYAADVAAAAQEFGSNSIIALSNEPDRILWQQPNQQQLESAMWQHRWYVEDVLAHRARYNGAKLLAPAIQPIDRLSYQHRAEAWLLHPLGGSNLHETYSKCDGVAIHVYDWYDAAWLAKEVAYYHDLYPHHQLYITEYGIADTRTVSTAQKVQRYREFVGMMRKLPYVEMTAMFICGVDLPGGFPEYIVGEAVAGLAGA